jgi:hypothetical protein
VVDVVVEGSLPRDGLVVVVVVVERSVADVVESFRSVSVEVGRLVEDVPSARVVDGDVGVVVGMVSVVVGTVSVVGLVTGVELDTVTGTVVVVVVVAGVSTVATTESMAIEPSSDSPDVTKRTSIVEEALGSETLNVPPAPGEWVDSVCQEPPSAEACTRAEPWTRTPPGKSMS